MKNFVAIIAVILVLGGIYWTRNNTVVAPTTEEEIVNTNYPLPAKDESNSVDEMVVMEEKPVTPLKNGSYEAYSPEKLAKAQAGKVVLFFNAGWCPTCRALDGDIKANLGKIPENLTILNVDYDNSSALKQKYGVTYQHTFVQVDKDGNLLKKWSGSATLSSFVTSLNK